MASLIVKTMLGEAATPKNVAILFAVITILLVSLMMYFFSKDCSPCSFRMLKYFVMWGLGAALIGYVVGQGVQMGPSFSMSRMGVANMVASQMTQPQSMDKNPLIQEPLFTLSQTQAPTRNITTYRGQPIMLR